MALQDLGRWPQRVRLFGSIQSDAADPAAGRTGLKQSYCLPLLLAGRALDPEEFGEACRRRRTVRFPLRCDRPRANLSGRVRLP